MSSDSILSNNIDNNSSLNTLLGSFTTLAPETIIGSFDNSFTEAICIDSSTNRIGINTLDPSYSIHIMDYPGISGNIYASEITGISGSFDKLFLNEKLFSNRIGINTLDPSYSIHIMDYPESSGNIYASEITGISGSFDKLFLYNLPILVNSINENLEISLNQVTDLDNVELNQVYVDATNGNILKIKLPPPF